MCVIYIYISSTQHGMMHHDHAHNLHASNNALLANVCLICIYIYIYICRYVRMHVCINNIYARIPRIMDKIDHLIYKP